MSTSATFDTAPHFNPTDQGRPMNKLLSTLILAAFAAFAVNAQAAAPSADSAASAPAKKADKSASAPK